MTWTSFIYFGVAASLLSAVGAMMSIWNQKQRWAIVLSVLAILVLGSFITGLWITFGRPPLRTMGETRLWYSFFAMISGLFTYLRWKYKWIK